MRDFDLVHCVGQVCMHKLGIAKSVKVNDIVAQGAAIGVDAFCGDWWQSDSHWGQVVDKSRRPRRLTWYAMFRNALFLTCFVRTGAMLIGSVVGSMPI